MYKVMGGQINTPNSFDVHIANVYKFDAEYHTYEHNCGGSGET